MIMEDLQGNLSIPPSSSYSPLLDLHPFSIDSEIWLMAEKRTQEILSTVQPAFASEQKRREVIDYIQRLIKRSYAIEVFPFGSVPLKTYLPDGDIDLTVLTHQNMEEDLAKDVCSILECEEQDPEFEVKDVQYIQAQVKIVKCSVNNISVDISFNQMTGLCALCFLEQVDQLVGKDHLLKRSIILIKAWCFYESRILGAHYGLISTYALEIMVLHIVNLFHSSLPGPLAVLHRFLDYYSTFDWDNYCVSINGPVAIASLTEILAVQMENSGSELLLNQEFLRNCREIFSVPMKALENGSHEFPVKHLNIIDPLKESNNLGRSVNKGNFHRIKCALSHGAQSLGDILMLPGENMGAGLEKFFINTLDRNGRGERPDVQVPVPAFGTERADVSDLCGNYDNYYSCLLHGQSYHNYSLPAPRQPSPPSEPQQTHQTSAQDALPWLLQCKQNVFGQRGTDVFVPRLAFRQPRISQLYAATSGVDKIGKSRGTGTYIPNMTHHPYKDLPPKTRSCKSPRKTDQTDEPPGMEKCESCKSLDLLTNQHAHKTSRRGNGYSHDSSFNQFSPEAEKKRNADRSELLLDHFGPETEKRGNDKCFDLSLDQFPLLPCIKKSVPSEIHPLCQHNMNSSRGNDCCPAFPNIQFGTFGLSPSPCGLPSLTVMKQGNSGVSSSSETMQAFSGIGLSRQQELLESNNEMFLKQYQLKDDEDFPPLCQECIFGQEIDDFKNEAEADAPS